LQWCFAVTSRPMVALSWSIQVPPIPPIPWCEANGFSSHPYGLTNFCHVLLLLLRRYCMVSTMGTSFPHPSKCWCSQSNVSQSTHSHSSTPYHDWYNKVSLLLVALSSVSDCVSSLFSWDRFLGSFPLFPSVLLVSLPQASGTCTLEVDMTLTDFIEDGWSTSLRMVRVLHWAWFEYIIEDGSST
jgi:hypothetical protein